MLKHTKDLQTYSFANNMRRVPSNRKLSKRRKE